MRPLAWGGVVGPAAFVADWAVLGARRAGYSPISDAVSRLAETGASTRLAMTGGFLVYGTGLVAYGMALREGEPSPAWPFAILTGIATFGVAAFPLGTPTSGTIHAVFAAAGYVTLAATPIAAGRALRAQGRRGLARLSVVTGVVSAGFLLASIVTTTSHGLTQRIGLTAGDAWIVASAASLLLRPRPAQAR